ncbi:chaplin [Actinocrinis puniceicyclus]|uniref:Chaplin n=1 Tax=Actinocrinis puniceicyclus TaxID=977794 RepID=A0A8J8BE05_9ACTN|nr:chaplin [Actinocrinis puniceicyclus]MBS2966772.1 chaplin [Actinocrinis puniceicyclus]
MQGFAKRGLALVAATSGLVLGTAGFASADATASGTATNSGGVASGNVTDTALSAPVNFCGNQVGMITAYDSVAPQLCANGTGNNASAQGSSADSGGILSGNVADTALSAPVNLCGNQVDVIGLSNAVLGSSCVNG